MDSEFLEAKLNFTLKYCAQEIEKPVKDKFDRLQSLKWEVDQLQYSSAKPDTSQVRNLISDVSSFLPTVEGDFKAIGPFCGENEICRECAAKEINYNEIWKRYMYFYYQKIDFLANYPLRCKITLVKYDSQSLLKEEVKAPLTKLLRVIENMNKMFSATFAPMKRVMQSWVKDLNQVVSMAAHWSPGRLCEPNSPCQQFIEDTVNCCLNSNNATYGSLPCRKPNEWRLLGYTPASVHPNCILKE